MRSQASAMSPLKLPPMADPNPAHYRGISLSSASLASTYDEEGSVFATPRTLSSLPPSAYDARRSADVTDISWTPGQSLYPAWGPGANSLTLSTRRFTCPGPPPNGLVVGSAGEWAGTASERLRKKIQRRWSKTKKVAPTPVCVPQAAV